MFLAEPPHSAAVEAAFDDDRRSDGYVNNNTRAWAYRPDVLRGFVDLRGMVTDGSTLTEREIAVMVASTASARGDSYCALAWGTRLARLVDETTAAAVVAGGTGDGLTQREAALASWARSVVVDPNATTAADVDALRDAGLSDREVFDATMFVALRLAYSTLDDALGAEPDLQLAERTPPTVRAAVTFGRPTAATPSD